MRAYESLLLAANLSGRKYASSMKGKTYAVPYAYRYRGMKRKYVYIPKSDILKAAGEILSEKYDEENTVDQIKEGMDALIKLAKETFPKKYQKPGVKAFHERKKNIQKEKDVVVPKF